MFQARSLSLKQKILFTKLNFYFFFQMEYFFKIRIFFIVKKLTTTTTTTTTHFITTRTLPSIDCALLILLLRTTNQTNIKISSWKHTLTYTKR